MYNSLALSTSYYCITIITIYLKNFFIFPNPNSVPIMHLSFVLKSRSNIEKTDHSDIEIHGQHSWRNVIWVMSPWDGQPSKQGIWGSRQEMMGAQSRNPPFHWEDHSFWFCIPFNNNMKGDNSTKAIHFSVSFGSTGMNIPTQFSYMVQCWYIKNYLKIWLLPNCPQRNYHWAKGKVVVTIRMVSFLQSKQHFSSKNNQPAHWVTCIYMWLEQ